MSRSSIFVLTDDQAPLPARAPLHRTVVERQRQPIQGLTGDEEVYKGRDSSNGRPEPKDRSRALRSESRFVVFC